MEAKLKAKLASQLSAKRKRDQLEEAISTLAACDLRLVYQLEDKRVLDVILGLKFDEDVIDAISYIAQQLPEQLPVNLREEIIGDVVTNLHLKVSLPDAIELHSIFTALRGLDNEGKERPLPQKMANCKTPLFCVLKPPCTTCLDCGGALCYYNTPSKVTVFTLDDIKPGLKITLKCNQCNISYGYARYGDSKKGYKFYGQQRQYIEASNVTYMQRQLCLSQVFLA